MDQTSHKKLMSELSFEDQGRLYQAQEDWFRKFLQDNKNRCPVCLHIETFYKDVPLPEDNTHSINKCPFMGPSDCRRCLNLVRPRHWFSNCSDIVVEQYQRKEKLVYRLCTGCFLPVRCFEDFHSNYLTRHVPYNINHTIDKECPQTFIKFASFLLYEVRSEEEQAISFQQWYRQNIVFDFTHRMLLMTRKFVEHYYFNANED